MAAATGAAAVEVRGSLIETRLTSVWNPPSPDPSGIGYDPRNGRFIISDGEVEEMAIYAGANLFDADTDGALVDTTNTDPWSHEPTGVAINPNNGEIYVSDDDQRSVFVLDSLSDTSPGVIGAAKFTATGVDPDLEGVAYDSARNEILLANGERGAGFFRVKPGTDSRFGTSDDVVNPKILVSAAGDPEGIAYDAVRDTVVLVDSATDKIYELNATGLVLNTISLAGMGMDAAAGIEVAPASNGSGARNYYIVDRGVDNNTDPNENDGRIFEVAATLPGASANQPPTANAGRDQVITLGQTATLTGTGSDVETPANQLTYRWTKQSGPTQPVTFTPNDAATTTASFTAAGTYVLRLAVTDGGSLTSSDLVTVTVSEPGADVTVDVPVAAGSDDAYQGTATGGAFVDVTSRFHHLGNRQPATGAAYPVLTGLRFANIPVPQGATIVNAQIRFAVDSATTGPAALTIKGEAADNALTFGGSGNISARTRTTASVNWAPADWPTAGAQVLTPNLATVLQQIVDRQAWAAGNAAVFLIDGDGRRAAKAFESGTPPVLLLTYAPKAATNEPPTVNAGPDMAVTMPAAANLNGTVTDDGKPTPPTVASTWAKVSGPGTVAFGDATLADTTATFSAPGVYTLRLTANDGELPGHDDVIVTVAAAPTGGGGGGGGGGTTNTAPNVDAGADQSVTAGSQLRLNGTVSDDGQPAPYTVAWSKVSGPGAVTFGDAAAVDTTASFSEAGVYTIRLTADDSALTGRDDLIVAVSDGEEDVAISLSGPKRKLEFGRTARLRGSLEVGGASGGGELVQIFVKRGKGVPFRFLANVATADDGSFAYRDRPRARSVYMARSNGEWSERVVVRVMPRLRAWVTDATVGKRERTAIRGLISPAHEGQRLRLQQWTGHRWRVVRTVVLPDGNRVRFSFGLRHRKAGTKKYRVVSPAYAGMARAVEGTLRIQVRRGR